MRIIDADALKSALKTEIENIQPFSLKDLNYFIGVKQGLKLAETVIDNAPELGYEDGILTVENVTRKAIELEVAYNNGWSDGFSEGENKRPEGKWIFHKDFNESCRYGCNQCGNLTNIPNNFCPNCGADMRKGGAE